LEFAFKISYFEHLLNFVNNKFEFAFKVLTKTEHLTQKPTHFRAICRYNTDTVLSEVRNEHKEQLTVKLSRCLRD